VADRPAPRADQLGHDETGTAAGSVPAKESLDARPIVTAGLVKLVDDVK
jgi:hypothetical protein